MNSPHMFKSKGNNIDMQLAQWGKGEDCILCVHGMTANCRFSILFDQHPARDKALASFLR